jgi:hypothetical protein
MVLKELNWHFTDKGAFSISTTAKLPLTLSFSSVDLKKEVEVSTASSTLEIDLVSVSTLDKKLL